ncbi:MAG: class I SAM-dependent methyltransferase [Phycisphaerae bacterium]|nr:class I SAM-dependent methyltransferase [Phycisphaerae bacterium]
MGLKSSAASIANGLLGPLGLRLVRKGSLRMGQNVGADMIDLVDFSVRTYDGQTDALPILRTVAPYTMTNLERLMSLYQVCRYVERRGIPGDLVECGVWRGGSSGVMAAVNLSYGKKPRDLWLYDSFEGIPAPLAIDGVAAKNYVGGKDDGSLQTTNCLVAEESYVLELLGKLRFPRDRTHVVKGWFQNTVPVTQPKQIAILRLDGDWYESTKVCLDHLYPLVAKGGAIVIDDYGDWEGCKKAVDEYLASIGFDPMLHHADRTCRYFFKE